MPTKHPQYEHALPAYAAFKPADVERPMSRYNIGRNAVLLPAAPGAAPTPPGGVRRQDLNLRYAVADGILSAFRARDQDPVHTMVGMEAVVTDTLALPRAEGLAQV